MVVMAIFSRRTLQRLVNENAKILSRKQTKDHVNRLNNSDINVEWEIVLLSVLSKLGTVIHEKNFNGKNPDIYFVSQDASFSFLADIKTVSDKGIDLKNPFEYLNNRLQQEVLKYDIKGAWSIDVGGTYEEARRDGKMVQMKLPALARFDQEIFNERFSDFALLIKEYPFEPRRYEVKNDSSDLTFSYSPSDRWVGSGSYPSYKTIELSEHLIQNSLYSGLEDKADQLKKSAFDGVLGIFVCDGGSDFLLKGERIIREFLASHRHIHFVMGVWVDQQFGWKASSQIRVHCLFNDSIQSELHELLDNFHIHAQSHFPFAQRNASNAVHVLNAEKPEKLGSFRGGFTVRDNEIKLSSRTVLELLAGELSYEDFPDDYRNFFAEMMKDGKLFEKLDIEKSETEEDDDWLWISFGKPDPAVALFYVPE
ncbi:MAG: hypothetical protein ABIV48_08430 [Pyrinomonadaceae bacterium]